MNHVAAPFRRGIAELAQGRAEAAVPWLRQSIEIGQDVAFAGLNLGMALADLGRLAEALPHLHAATQALPHLAEPQFRLGQIAAQRQQHDAARQHFQAALDRDPAHVMSLTALAALAAAAGETEHAQALLAHARLLAPQDDGLRLMQLRHASTEDLAENQLEWLSLLREGAGGMDAVRLAASAPGALPLLLAEALRAPLHWPWQAAIGLARCAAGHAEDGVAALRLAAILADEAFSLPSNDAFDPSCHDAPGIQRHDPPGVQRHDPPGVQRHDPPGVQRHDPPGVQRHDPPGVQRHDASDIRAELGLKLAEQRRHTEAEPLLAAAILANPADATLRSQHGICLLRLHRLAEARARLEAAIADFGPLPSLLCNLALTLNSQGLQEDAWATSLRTGTNAAALGCRMGVQPYHPQVGDAASLHRTASAIGALLPRLPMPPHAPGFDPDRRLRVGFLSASFGRHPVGWLTLAGIEALPRDAIEVVCFSLRPMADALARRFHATAEIWRELPRLEDAALAEAIRADAPDILVDLGGHGEGGRVAALAHRAAPVQIKWVGAQSATTGVPGLGWAGC